MPPAVIPLVGAGLGAAGSAAGGKKGGDAASKQLQLQQQQLQFGRGLAQQGMGAWTPATDYWKSLLLGTPSDVQGAIGPISEQMRGQSAAGIRQLQSSMPAGGERNLAVASAQNQQYGDLARLYAGVQPQAASALGQLSSIPLGAGVGVMGQGAPQVGAGLWSQQMANQQAGQGMAGAGNLLFQGVNKYRQQQGKNGGGGGSSVPGGTGKES